MFDITRDHEILERCIRNTKNTDYKQNALLRFCFLLDFFQINNFFEIYEATNPSLYSSNVKSEGYDKTRAISIYKKNFFNDSIRSSKPNRISDTLLPFWDFFISTIMTPAFKDSLANPIQKAVLICIQKNQVTSSSFLFDLVNNQESFFNFLGGTIISCDRNRLDYFVAVDEQQRMVEYFDHEYETPELSFPNKLFFEEIYSNEIAKYDIYRGLLDNLHSVAYSSSKFSLSEEELASDLSFWNIIAENWDILFFIFRNEPVWNLFIASLSLVGMNEISLKEQLSTIHDISSDRLSQIIIKSETSHLILNYNFKPNKRTATQILNKINKKRSSFISILFLEFCKNNRFYIKNLDETSIKYIYRLLILS